MFYFPIIIIIIIKGFSRPEEAIEYGTQGTSLVSTSMSLCTVMLLLT